MLFLVFLKTNPSFVMANTFGNLLPFAIIAKGYYRGFCLKFYILQEGRKFGNTFRIDFFVSEYLMVELRSWNAP
jgi:hypothetical protein